MHRVGCSRMHRQGGEFKAQGSGSRVPIKIDGAMPMGEGDANALVKTWLTVKVTSQLGVRAVVSGEVGDQPEEDEDLRGIASELCAVLTA